jgi:hydroxypyruvate reductase
MQHHIASCRVEARRLFDIAVLAADPAKALRAQFDAPLGARDGGRLILIAVGKAACPMMQEALTHATGDVTALAVTNSENHRDLPGATVLHAGHPVPDEHGLKAAQAVADLLDGATERDRVVALISGGGSALLPLPAPGITLSDKARTSEVLLSAGFDITQMNLVRQQLSQLKGGGMLRRAAPARVEAYILSDVVGDDLRVIASGPTVAPLGTRSDARAMLAPVWDQLLASVQAHLSADAEMPVIPEARNTLICSNRKSLEAMAAANPAARIVDDRLEGNVADVAPRLAELARTAQPGEVLLFGGETTVTLTGTGKGGRNQDLALRMALAQIDGDWVFLSGGTDGRDGPTDAAGGLVDSCSATRMRDAGLNPEALLANNDAYAALHGSGDLVMTGGTGTNVADVQILFRL